MVSVVAVFYSLLLCCIILEGGGGACVDAGLAGAAAPGDITIAGIFPIHGAVAKQDIFSPQPQRCIRLDETGLTRALVMISAVEAINESPVLNDIGVTLGYQIYDSCADVSMALRATADFTQPADCSGGRNACVCDQPVMVVVGASHSETSIAVARQLTLKKIPQISYSSTAVTLSDKTRFPTFMRTVPNDDYQTAAMVRLLGDYGWNWVGIITTDGDYGLSALNSFVSQASENGICVAFKSILPVSLTSQDLNSALRETVKTISNNPKVNVIVSFSKASHMKHLFQSLREEALGSGQTTESARRVWVASDSWSSSNSVQGQLKLEDIGHIVGFTFKNGDLSSFRRYLSRLEDASLDSIRNNSFLQEFYMQLNASGDTGGTVLLSEALKILQKYTHADTTLSIEMAVSAIAQAVASICSRKDCKTPGMVQPLEVLKALLTHKFQLGEKVYKFDSNGDINLGYDMNLWRSENGILHVDDVVAEYHPKNNSFTYTNHNTTKQLHSLRHIVSRCSNSCVPGEFKKTVEGQHTCCYECINCTENYYSNATDMDSCLSCDTKTHWAPAGSSSCIPKELQFFSWQDGFAVVLLAFAALGILLALLVSALFLRQRSTPIVRAAGGPLCQLILLSLVGSFVSTVLFVGRPSSFQCKARQTLFGINFTLCVSCILVKSLKILLAFQFKPERQELLHRLYRPYVIIIVCVALQVITCICWLVLKCPFKHVTPYPTTLLEDCHEGSFVAFGVMLGYIALLALVCFICAFKGRKLPHKYNDAKFITFSMLLYLISWVLFVPVYVTTSGVYLPAVEMVVILISNYGILSCHFFPKCYVILFKKEQNTQSAFKKNLYEYSSKSANAVSVTETPVSEQKVVHQPYIISALSILTPPHPPKCAVVTNCRDAITCTSLYRRSIRQHNCLTRSISI